jgi:hypothetical protein
VGFLYHFLQGVPSLEGFQDGLTREVLHHGAGIHGACIVVHHHKNMRHACRFEGGNCFLYLILAVEGCAGSCGYPGAADYIRVLLDRGWVGTACGG